jgi:hypothetical protein
LYIILVVILCVSISKILEPNPYGELLSSLYEPLEYYIDSIESNMNEITINDADVYWVEIKVHLLNHLENSLRIKSYKNEDGCFD